MYISIQIAFIVSKNKKTSHTKTFLPVTCEHDICMSHFIATLHVDANHTMSQWYTVKFYITNNAWQGDKYTEGTCVRVYRHVVCTCSRINKRIIVFSLADQRMGSVV